MKTETKLIVKINESPGITLNELCQYLSLTKGNISIHLKKLENKNLIKKYPLAGYQKNKRIHPTNKAKNLYLQNKQKLMFLKDDNKVT